MASPAAGSVVRTPVLIAGGGPVGMTLSMGLAKRGIRSIVLEAREGIPPNPRCNTTNARSMEIFRLLGCADAIRSAGLPGGHNTDVVYMTALAGQELTRFERPTPDDVRGGAPKGIGATWPSPEPQHFISQLYLEPVLRRHAIEAYDVDLRTGWRLEGFTEGSDGITAIARHVASGETATFACDYLVGADGSNSLVRHQMGAALEGMPALENTVSIFFRSTQVSELCARTPGWMYRFPTGAMLVAIGADEWLVHVQVPPGVEPETFDFEPLLFDAIGTTVAYEVISISRWTARAMVSNKFVEGRAIIAGDAAHIWLPMGGFGMNAGIGDADALAWRLSGILDGWLDRRILMSYESERVALGDRMAAQVPRWRRAIQPIMIESGQRRTELGDERNLDLREEFASRIQQANLSEWESAGLQLGFSYDDSPIVIPEGSVAPEFSIESYRESSVPGVRAPHVWRAGATRRSLYDDFGTGFSLLRIGASAPSGEGLIAVASDRGIPLAVIDVPEREALAKYDDFALVLVRPDQYVAWRSRADPDDPQTIFDVVTGRSIAPPEVATGAALIVAREPDFGTLARSPHGDRLFARDPSTGTIMHSRVRSDGHSGAWYPFARGLGTRGGIAVDQSGRVWVCETDQDVILGFSGSGRLIARVTTPPAPTHCWAAESGHRLDIAGSEGTTAWIAQHALPSSS